MQDTSPEESRRECDTQDMPARSLETRNPHTQEGPRRGVQWLWAALAGLTALERRRRRSSSHLAPTKNEERRQIGKDGRERLEMCFLTIECWILESDVILSYI